MQVELVKKTLNAKTKFNPTSQNTAQCIYITLLHFEDYIYISYCEQPYVTIL